MARQRGLLLRRELTRTARRWQFALFRTVTVLLMLIAFVVVLGQADAAQLARLPFIGRELFATVVILSMLFTITALPVQTIAAVQEERQGGTLDLLALTGVSPGQALWNAIATRNGVAILVLLGCAPLLSLLPTLGGISLTQVVNALTLIAALGLSITLIAGLMGVTARGAALALIAVAGWLFLFTILVPIELSQALLRADSPASYSFDNAVIAYAAIDSQSWVPLVGTIPWLITAIVAALLATWRFRTGVSTGWDLYSKAWPGPKFGWIGHLVVQVGGWTWLEVAGAGGSRYAGTGALGTPEHALLGLLVALVLITSGSIWYLRTMSWLLPRLASSRRLYRLPVVGDPVLWRELATNSAGGLSRGTVIATGVWAAVTGLLLLVNGWDKDIAIGAGLLAAVGSLLFSLLTVVSSIVQERTRKTLPVLASTTYPSWRIVAGKLIAAVVRVLPLTGLGLAIVVTAAPQNFLTGLWVEASPYERTTVFGPRIFQFVPAASLWGALYWLTGMWIVVLGQAVTLAVFLRGRAVAWAVPVVLGLAIPISMLMFSAAFRRHSTGVPELLFPLDGVFGAPYAAGMPIELAISGTLWWLVGFGLLAAASRVMATYASRRG